MRRAIFESSFQIESLKVARVLRLQSGDGMNRLTAECVFALTEAIRKLGSEKAHW